MKMFMMGMQIGFLSLAITTGAFAMGTAPGPKGYWKCAYRGDDITSCRPTPPWDNPGESCHTSPNVYYGDWFKARESAIEDARNRCESGASSLCQFKGCEQQG